MLSDPYLIIVVLLFILAISDLIVGVSNDAVNFLNSAIGSKVAPRHIIMIVASLGILIGSTFSSGMMEVARKGVFNPEFFVFAEIMVIFIAVMLTDIILLDLFNTVGLPTSTTVSIVFELLGAAVMMALIKLYDSGAGIYTLGDYINTSKALMIISGIFLSVIFAFVIGTIVQFLSRSLLSFKFRKKGFGYSLVWCSLAMTAMTYFLLFKGIRGTSFASEVMISFITTNMMMVVAISFLFWIVLLTAISKLKLDIYRLVVLFGTFSLAMAFAGNDLVNFIGVPIAGFESYLAWSATGEDALSYSMEILKEPVSTKTYLLVLSGLIMIVTLWFSKKARSVTETEVNLGRQDEGHERFTPNRIARSLVRTAVDAKKYVVGFIPVSWKNNTALQIQESNTLAADAPAFDLVRAGVNLTMASVLIAFATSLKLPLSTTYVSFMVAMGTSLADKAWGRDSAVYRVAGVLNVIGGWFATAIIAFIVCAIFTFLIYNFNLFAIGALVLLAIALITRSFRYHRKKEKQKTNRLAFESQTEPISHAFLLERISGRISELLDELKLVYHNALTSLIREEQKSVSEAEKAVKALALKNDNFQYELYRSIKRMEETDKEGSRLILYVYDLEQDILQSAKLIVKSIKAYLKNVLKPLKPEQTAQLELILASVGEYIELIKAFLKDPDRNQLSEIDKKKKSTLKLLESSLSMQVEGIKTNRFGSRNSQIVFKILLESKDLVAIAARLVKLYRIVHYYDRSKLESFLDVID